MPLLQFACAKCKHEFETLVFQGDEVVCPKCKGKKLERQATMPMAQVKQAVASACGDPSLPPCGAAGCRRVGPR